MALTKPDGSAAYAYYRYPAGKVGICFHVFAVMKLVAKWVIDKINKILEPKHAHQNYLFGLHLKIERDWKNHRL